MAKYERAFSTKIFKLSVGKRLKQKEDVAIISEVYVLNVSSCLRFETFRVLTMKSSGAVFNRLITASLIDNRFSHRRWRNRSDTSCLAKLKLIDSNP